MKETAGEDKAGAHEPQVVHFLLFNLNFTKCLLQINRLHVWLTLAQTFRSLTSTTHRPSSKTSNSTNHHPKDNSSSSNKNCWKCNDPAHISRNCPLNTTSNPKLRALFEHVDEIEAAYDAASSVADTICSMLDSKQEVDADDVECCTLLERLVSEHPVFLGHDE